MSDDKSWQDLGGESYELLRIGPNSLKDGQTLVVTAQSEPEVVDSEYGNSIKLACELVDAPEDYESVGTDDDSGFVPEEGQIYALMTSSSRFINALSEAIGDDDVTGNTFSVTGHAKDMARTYDVEIVE